MDLSVLTTLEYHKIRSMLAEKTSSVMGRELAEALVPTDELSQVCHQMEETREARDILAGIPNVPLGGIRDIRTLLKRAEIGAILEPHELLAVGSTLYASRRIKTFFTELPYSSPILAELVATIVVFRNIENVIDNTVNEQGNIRDDASVELGRIRREIKQAQSRMKDKLDSILRSSEYQKYFQDALVTIRGDRYVIPIKQEYRNQFPGIVHDQSASGATVFIEPMAVVNFNNDIKQLMSAERNEVERILQMVSGQIANVAPAVYTNCLVLGQIDFAFAKARLSFDMKATMPTINQNGYVNLQRARHPLIASDIVVPIDIYMGKNFNTLLITGPNTGGKTVTLKTLGLFALMTQAGLYIPAAAGSEMAVFQNVFADIGDEQSIEQSLSTFSSHMTNLVRILGQVSARDLVLIDEIGAGTDPDEGAALAMAILEYLLGVGARTIATTHYSELKTFAYSRKGIENASVEFDIQTLRPTYRLLIGIPGSSNAFAISRRLGLAENIIIRAKQLIDTDHAEFETVLTALEEQKLSYFKQNEEIDLRKQELALLTKKLTDEQAALTNKKKNILTKAQNDASLLLRQARREAEEVIAELKEQFSVQNPNERQNAVHNVRKRISDSLGNMILEEEEHENFPPLTPAMLKPGTCIYVKNLQQKGYVLSINANVVTVQIGIMKVNVPINDCRLAEDAAGTKKTAAIPGGYLEKASEIARQVDIRGITVDEAENILAK